MSALKHQILGVLDVKIEPFEMRGRKFHLREMDGALLSAMHEAYGAWCTEKKLDREKCAMVNYQAVYLIHTICEPDGKLVFGMADMSDVLTMPPAVIEAAFAAAVKLNAREAGSVEQAVKNS